MRVLTLLGTVLPMALTITTTTACDGERASDRRPATATNGDSLAPDTTRVHQLMKSALGTRWSFQTETIVLDPDTSAVIPGLIYVRGRRHADCIDCSSPEAIVGIRGDSARILREAIDWSALVNVWRPVSSALATAACIELIATTVAQAERPLIVREHTGLDSDGFLVRVHTVQAEIEAPNLLQGASIKAMSDSARRLFRQHRPRMHAPRATRDAGEGWAIVLWSAENTAAFRYRCWFPDSGRWTDAEPVLTVLDSVWWPEAPPLG